MATLHKSEYPRLHHFIVVGISALVVLCIWITIEIVVDMRKDFIEASIQVPSVQIKTLDLAILDELKQRK